MLIDRVAVGVFAVLPVVLDERELAIVPEIIERNKVERTVEALVIDRIFEVREELKLTGQELKGSFIELVQCQLGCKVDSQIQAMEN